MSMDQWFLLKCSSCRATLRIKSAYVHMRGKCPVCGIRIQPPQPKPLIMSEGDEPSGLVPMDEEWPEPATALSKEGDASSEVGAVYGMNQDVSPGTGSSRPQEEEIAGSVYSLAFDPNESRTPGISRSAEWDQHQQTPLVSAVPAFQVNTTQPEPAKSIVNQAPELDKNVYVKTVIDPLFGDEVKVVVQLPATPAPVEDQKRLPVHDGSQQPPLARVPTAEELKLQDSIARPHVPMDPQRDPAIKKKKKKKKEATEPAEDLSRLNKPTEETHMYRLSEAEENRIKPDDAPKSLFFEGVFTFPWEPRNIASWIWLSIGFTVCILLFRLIAYVGEAGGMFAGVGMGALGMASLLLVVFTLSYGCGCWLNTINYTSAGSKAVEWTTEGWRENIITFLRIGYYFALALMMATPLFVFNLISIGVFVWLMGALFLFPVFMFSGMASLTFWNFLHGDVIKRVMLKSHLYLLMYGLMAVIFFVAGVPAYFAIQYGWLCLIAGPLCAAAWLIYGRLLGRMAYQLQQEPKRKKKKKKKRVEDTTGSEEDTDDSEVNEKGPREDARGPGGARPV